MQRSYSILIVLLLCTTGWAQGPDTLWTRAYGGATDDWGYDIIQAADGNYVISGATQSYGDNPATGNAWIVKLNDSGDTLWTKVYGGTGGEDVDAIQQTTDGGFILAGYTDSFGAGGADFYLLKLDGAGNLEWSRTYGGSNHEEARGVRATSDGGYILVGYTRSFGPGVPDFENFYVVKTNSVGDTLWTRTYGGANGETAYGVEQSGDGNYVVAGYTSSYGGSAGDAWLLKINANGDSLWSHRYGGPSSEKAYALTSTSDGGYALAGFSSSFPTVLYEAYLVKVDSAGNQQWTRHYGGSDYDQAYSVQQTYDGGYILAGITKSFGPGIPTNNNYYIVKTNAAGDTLWTRWFGGSADEVANAVRQVDDGGYIVAGSTRSFGPSVPNANIYVVRLATETPLVTPQHLVTVVRNDSLIFGWDNDDNPFYRIYSDPTGAGTFSTLEGSTSDTTFVITNIANLRRFYRVVGSVGP
jgi:hypothetical protein